MSAERSTESIIDLLYGEISEDEANGVREDLAESAQLQEFQSLLGRVREVMPVEDVSPSIHASIMNAARVAAQNVSDDDRVIRRAAPEQGFWSRVGGGQGAQIALVATVLIAGLFVVKGVDRSSSPMLAPAADISSMTEMAPQSMPRPVVAAADGEAPSTPGEGGAGGEAVADQWTIEPSAPEAEPPAEEADIATSLRAELQRSRDDLDVKTPPPQELAVAKDEQDAPAQTRAKKRAPPRKIAAAKPRPTSSASKVDSLYVGDVDSDDSGRGNSSSAPSGLVQGKSGMDYAPVAPEPEAAAEATKKQEYRAPANSLSEVNQYFRAGDYGGTIGAANEFLDTNKSASAADRASAMFFKAQSLEKQGKYSEADRVYEQIQKNYPTFETAQIERARTEIRRKDVRKPSPKSRRKADDRNQSAPESIDVF